MDATSAHSLTACLLLAAGIASTTLPIILLAIDSRQTRTGRKRR